MARIAFVENIWIERMGVMLLSANLKKYGHQTKLFMDNSNIIKNLQEYKPHLISFSCISGEHPWALNLAKNIKEIMKDTLIIMGGPHPTFFPEVIEKDSVDIICRGEGEETFVELANKIDNKENITDILNLWLKQNNKIYKNDVRPFIQNLSDFPWADREIYKESHTFFQNSHTKRVYISRGCAYNCSYCHNHMLRELYKNKGKFMAHRNIDDIINEIKWLISNHPFKTIAFTAESLTTNKKWVLEFLKTYEKEIKYPFVCNTTFNELSEDVIIALKNANVHCLFIGLESGNENIRRDILHKNITNKQIIETGKLLRKYKVKFMTYNMVGMPDESIKNAFETIELNRRIKTNYPWCSILQPYVRTKIFDYAMERGYISEEDVNDISALYMHSSVMKKNDIRELENLQKLFIICAKIKLLPFHLIKILIKLPLKKIYHLLFILSFGYYYRKRNNLSYLDLIKFGFLTLSKYRKK
ncbi:B12-binding domain-containing radical SAM protein [bacterium]